MLSQLDLLPKDDSGFQYRPLSRDGFEIAIICALPRETNAVLCGLDEIWHDYRHYYGKTTGDNNCYDFGRIGTHCVVVVTLPNMGSVKASSASQSLKMSFNSIKLALLVGICGAVPFKKDGSEILLGDVIISEAIVELDYGRQYHNNFERKNALLDVHGRLNEEIVGLLQRWKAPTILETLQRGSVIHLRYLLQRLNSDYPGICQDLLFRSDYVHRHRENCGDCSGITGTVCQSAVSTSCNEVLCDDSQLVPRNRLTQAAVAEIEAPEPAIHIGSIGTGNSVLKSALHRDHYANSEGIIAFEMEGVGVWDKFNCLVIKGVCDYADSHKNKIWQDYAAASAVAVTKEVLRQYVMPQKPQQPILPDSKSRNQASKYTTNWKHPRSAGDSRFMSHYQFYPYYAQSNIRNLQGFQGIEPRVLPLKSIENSPNDSEREQRDIRAHQQILASLRFPQMQDRGQQIAIAHEETYDWVLSPQAEMCRWDDLAAWLSSDTENKKIFWISGKPGSGKSTLMRFLDQSLSVKQHMLPWAQGSSVIRASYFSWSPGNRLQKSLTGLLRSFLSQILKQKPSLTSEVVDDTRWAAVQASSNAISDWSDSELRSCVQRCITNLRDDSVCVVLLVDGLDEFEGTDEIHEEHMRFFRKLASTGNVKMILSGRPWNVFQDDLSDFPKIRLEDLTRDDIRTYVRSSFLDSPRFRYLISSNQHIADSLIFAITEKAVGVFLWVRLVVRDLLKGIRDGDSIETLKHKLEETPAELNDYFERLFFSIEPRHRREASIILQVALYEEHDFTALHPLRLLDLSFTDEPDADSALKNSVSGGKISMKDRGGLRFHLDSTARRLNSRCMGLLECTYNPESFFDLFSEEFVEDLENTSRYQGLKFEPSMYSEVFDGPELSRSFMLTVDFLHRSCRDFLLSPQIQIELQQYTRGPYDVRLLLVSARIAQLQALREVEFGHSIALGISSFIASALSVAEWKESPTSVEVARLLQPTIEACSSFDNQNSMGWYISPVLNSWHKEKSNFLSLAIDFDMRGYCLAYLTRHSVQSKKGRPILDYILRPRFAGRISSDLRIGNSVPKVDLLQRALDFGADPNALHDGVSVWARFLSYAAQALHEGLHTSIVNNQIYYTALKMMIDRGAAPALPCSWFASQNLEHSNYQRYGQLNLGYEAPNYWPKSVPTIDVATNQLSQSSYLVADLLATFEPYFGPDVNELITTMNAKAQESYSIGTG